VPPAESPADVSQRHALCLLNPSKTFSFETAHYDEGPKNFVKSKINGLHKPGRAPTLFVGAAAHAPVAILNSWILMSSP
jgi:hypothetical protein